MIRKLARVDAPVEAVKAVFAQVETWPDWMPFIRASTVLERTAGSMRVDLKLLHMGHEHKQTVEFTLDKDRFTQHQIKGPFKRWEGEWRFSPTPEGSGTTVSLALDFEIGMLGAFVPKRVIQGTFDEFFTKMVENANARVRRTMTAEQHADHAARRTAVGERLIQVFQTPGGLEIWIGGQRHFLKAG